MKLILLLLAAWSAAAPAPRGGSAPADAALGRKVFQTRCAACHGEEAKGSPAFARRAGAGSPDALDLTSPRLMQLSDDELARGIQTGHGRMRGFGERLTAKELAAVVGYIRLLGHARTGGDAGRRQARADR